MDKWPQGKVEVFQALSNNLVNSYWEANLPPNFRKPASNANSFEVVNFLTDKYINKKWVDTDMKYDPLYLFENKKSRFEKFVKRQLARQGIGADSSDSADERKAPASKPSGTGSSHQSNNLKKPQNVVKQSPMIER